MTEPEFLKLSSQDMFSYVSKKLINGQWTVAQHKAAIQKWQEANTVKQ